ETGWRDRRPVGTSARDRSATDRLAAEGPEVRILLVHAQLADGGRRCDRAAALDDDRHVDQLGGPDPQGAALVFWLVCGVFRSLHPGGALLPRTAANSGGRIIRP